MPEQLTAAQRVMLGRVADLMMPAAAGMPSAVDADVAGAGADRVLTLRPEITPIVAAALDTMETQPPTSVTQIRAGNVTAFPVLGELVTSAYFTAPVVLQRFPELSRPRKPLPDLQIEATELDKLTAPLLAAGPRFRATPA